MSRPQKPKKNLQSRVLLKLREALVFRANIKGQHGPIKIINLSLQDNADEFVAVVEKALLLLENCYPRGYRRVKRDLRYIANVPTLSLGAYEHSARACRIDFLRFKLSTASESDQWAVAYFACLVIHEATHGHLLSRGVPYDVNTRVRVERVCVREAARFAARLHTDAYDPTTLVHPFDESNWKDSWNRTPLQRTKLVALRLVKDIRETSKKLE